MYKTIPTDIPALSACILTSNSSPPKSNTGYMRRVIDREFSKEEYHRDDDEATRRFELFLSENLDKLRILGDFRTNYILAHQKELILDRKLKPFEISQKVLEAFYEHVGTEEPEWIYKLLPQNQIEEAIQDIESIVRRALIDIVNNTYRSYIGQLQQGNVDVSVQGRFDECCDKQLFPFVKKEGEGDDVRIIINSSIMHEFWNNPRYGIDRSVLSGLRALGDIVGLAYGKKGSQACDKDNRKRVIYGKQVQLMAFLNDIEPQEKNS